MMLRESWKCSSRTYTISIKQRNSVFQKKKKETTWKKFQQIVLSGDKFEELHNNQVNPLFEIFQDTKECF